MKSPELLTSLGDTGGAHGHNTVETPKNTSRYKYSLLSGKQYNTDNSLDRNFFYILALRKVILIKRLFQEDTVLTFPSVLLISHLLLSLSNSDHCYQDQDRHMMLVPGFVKL